MPVLSSESRNAPRSSLRHRPIETGKTAPDPTIMRQRRPRSDVPAAPATVVLADPDLAEKEEEEQVPRKRGRGAPTQQGEIIVPVRRRPHPLFFVGLGLMLAVLLWTGITQAIIWGNNQLNTLRYGYPRTYQIDAFVGQGDSVHHPSHFVALNLHGVVTIVDFPGGDPSRVRVVASTQVPGSDADQAVVTLRFIDARQNGLPDMLVTIGGIQSILINDGKTFRPPTPAEEQQIIQYMQRHQQTGN